MRRYDVITEICDAMLELGWEPYQNDHEDANGQFEMNWEYDDALVTADRHAFFKYHGQVDRREARPARDLHAEAVPQPDRQWLPRPCLAVGRRRRNLFADGSRRARPVADSASTSSAGMMHAADALCAITNPDGELLQAHQRAAHDVRRHLVAEHGDLDRQQPHPHDPRAGRRAVRAAPARRRGQSLSAAGGHPRRRPRRHQNQRDPGKRLDIDMYTDGHTVKDAKRLPLNLLDALRAFEAHQC